MTDLAETRTAPLPLWRVAGEFLRTLFNLFGDPETLAAKHTLTYANYRLALDWLRSAEALVRQLLFIEASAFPKLALARVRTPRARREPRPHWFTPEEPQAWRVSFRCTLGAPASSPAGAVRKPAPVFKPRKAVGARFRSAWPLAERFEAVLRAYNDPAPYAKRLARRLHASAKLITRILNPPIELAHRIGETTYAQIRVLCASRRACFVDTT